MNSSIAPVGVDILKVGVDILKVLNHTHTVHLGATRRDGLTRLALTLALPNPPTHEP